MFAKNRRKEGGKPKVVMDVFKGNGAGGTSFQVRDVGDYLTRGPVPGWVLTQGSHTYHCEEFPSVSRQELVVPNFADSNA